MDSTGDRMKDGIGGGQETQRSVYTLDWSSGGTFTLQMLPIRLRNIISA